MRVTLSVLVYTTGFDPHVYKRPMNVTGHDVFRVTMSTVVLVGGAACIAGYASFGFYEGSAITLLAVGLPLVIVCSRLAARLAHNLNPRMLGSLVGGLVLLAGVALLLR
jgi:uncharacterized membrane protein YfcA